MRISPAEFDASQGAFFGKLFPLSFRSFLNGEDIQAYSSDVSLFQDSVIKTFCSSCPEEIHILYVMVCHQIISGNPA